MTMTHDILCIGSVLWDVIGRTQHPMRVGSDEPGRITRLPGGVAMNIAMTAQRFDLRPALLTAIGRDAEGEELLAECGARGMVTTFVHRPSGLPTDVYMAIEGPQGLVAALADAHSLEAAGDAILAPLEDGTLGSAKKPYTGVIALDGNLTLALLTDIAKRPSFAAADLRVAPASPGKARRLTPLMEHPGATLYVNREEAGYLANQRFDNALEAAEGLLAAGANRVLVTDGGSFAADGSKQHGVIQTPCPAVRVRRITGAGDTFMAAHIAAEMAGKAPVEALAHAQETAAHYVSGEDDT
ncbi:bifunctional hydroxymethylpyrimidine kinase/phosphomethylpyrimidine kinase [Aliiroseovarius sp. Z3]|uniref:PfkB family carbohydrate kinase n=1 Tax=Aliiroseovarius sp. Z3 TaxID=2811402 RepID=UPI0023B314F5|nr:PfkB family carbohydrate kinase [Aliiroseovarius sp. Z3]MDE9449002.1 bifunctional hydroxymethylpyrimidine kinase/phosphomethylpyrimidine kinase [Aliiroseovarius sp. Z3]